ncbi:hypothetical protein SprV_0501831800 [Sparganum proliferum]
MCRKFKKEAVTNRSKIPKAKAIPLKVPQTILPLMMNPGEMPTTSRAVESEPEERRVRRPHQDWSDGNDAAISNLLGERNNLHRAYFDRPTDADKVAFYQYRRLAQQRWRKIQDSWIAHKVMEIQGYADRNESANFFTAIKAVCGLPTKGSAPLLSSDGSAILMKKSQIRKRPQPSLHRPPSSDSPERKSTSTWTSCPLSQEPSAPCDNSPPEMHSAPVQSRLKSTSPASTD